MEIIKGYIVDSEDKIRPCPCGGNYYNTPEMVSSLELDSDKIRQFVYDIIGIAFCPSCGKVTLWTGKDKTIIN
jgi:hypothetical protein